MLFVLKSRPEL